MRSKSIFVIGALLAVIMVFGTGTDAFAQVDWYDSPDGVGLTSTVPGKATNDTFQIILGDGAQLTVGNFMEIDLSSFQVDKTQAETESNYSFFSFSSDISAKMGSSDFSATFTDSTGILLITLVTDNSLIPDDSLRIILSNVTTNKGTKGSSSQKDYTVRIRTSDQPVFATDTDTDSRLDNPNDNAISALASADSLSSNTNWIMITMTANGQYPKDGIFDVILPENFTFTSVVNNASQKDTIVVQDDGVDVTLSSVSASGRTLKITLNNATPIADGSIITIKIGNGTSIGKVVNNPSVFSRSAPNSNQTISYNSGFTSGILLTDNATRFTVIALDADLDTVALDKAGAGSASFLVRSNWFPPSNSNAGQGGVFINDNTAGSLTSLDIQFKVSTLLNTVGSTDTLIFLFDPNEFTVDADADADHIYTFTGGSFSDTTMFDVVIASATTGEIKIIPQGDGFLDFDTDISLNIKSGFIRNLAEASDVDVQLRTSDQATFVTDIEDDPIAAATGGIITVFALADSNAGEQSAIDSMVFTVSSFIPLDAKFVISFPSQFTTVTLIDSVHILIDTNRDGVYEHDLSNTGVGMGDSVVVISSAAGTIQNNEIILQLQNVTKDLSSPFPANSNVKIILGDTLSTVWNPAFTNPSPTEAGTYPTPGSLSPIRVKLLTSAGGLLATGDNSTAPFAIKTNDWGMEDFLTAHYQFTAGQPADSQAAFVFPIPGTTVEKLSTTDTDTAAHKTGLKLFFSLGSPLVGNSDTLFIELGNNFLLEPAESDNATTTPNLGHVTFTKGVADNDGGPPQAFGITTSFISSKNALAIVPDGTGASSDTILADSLIIMNISDAGIGQFHGGGMLSNLGSNPDIRLNLWTSRQSTKVAMDSVDLIVISDTLRTLDIVKSDSTAGETSNDSLIFAWNNGVLPPGSYFTIELDDGNTITPSANLGIDVSLFAGLNKTLTVTNFTASDITGSGTGGKVKILVNGGAGTDTLGLKTIAASDKPNLAFGDSVKVFFGNGSITNIHPDSLTSRVRAYSLGTSDSLYYTVRAFDANDDTIFTQGIAGSVDPGRETHIVANFFAGGKILHFNGTGAVGSNAAFIAGGAIDTLSVPFQVGTPIVGGTISFTFDGAIYTDEATAEVESNYVIKGDAAGTATFTLIEANTAPDNVITFTLGATDSIGGTDALDNVKLFIPFQETLLVIGVLTALGTDGIDGLDVSFTTPDVQDIAVTDTFNIPYNLNIGNQTLTTGKGPASPIAGAYNNFKMGWDPAATGGSSHGVVVPGGQIVLRFPIEQDSSKVHGGAGTGRYEFGFPTFTPGALSIGDFRVVGEGTANTLDTLTLSSATYAVEDGGAGLIATTPSDTGVITLTIGGTTIVNSDSLLTIDILNNKLRNPLEATDDGGSANNAHDLSGIGGFDHSNLPANETDYLINVQVKDGSGNLMTAGRSQTESFNHGTHSGFLILLPGQKYDPGGDGTLFDADTVIAGNGFMPLVLAVDANNNVIADASADGNVTVTAHSGSDAADGPAIRFIGDEVSANANNLIIGTDTGDRRGQGYFGRTAISGVDSLILYQAADGRADLGRAGLFKNIKVTDGSKSGTSNILPVTNNTISKIVVIVDQFEVIDQTGDSTSHGKTQIKVPFELAQGATFTVNVFPVDTYLNRVDTTTAAFSPATTLTVSAPGLNSSVSTTDFNASTFLSTFTINPSTIGTDQTITVNVTSTPAILGQTKFDVVGVIATAVFTALADTSNKLGDFHSFTTDLTFSGSFGSTDSWTFWTHTDSTFSIMNEDQGGLRQSQLGIVQSGELGVKQSFGGSADIRSFIEGAPVYIYVTVTADSPNVIARSPGVFVRHFPQLTSDSIFPKSADGDTVVNSNILEQIDLKFEAKDVDTPAGQVPVSIFLIDEGKPSLDETDFTDGQLDGVDPISTSLDAADTSFTFKFVTRDSDNNVSSFENAGVFFVYVVADDGNNVDVQRSQSKFQVKHSPKIGLDRPASGLSQINTKNQQILTINWSRTGDSDIDQNASIALFADTTGSDHTTASSLLDANNLSRINITNAFNDITEDSPVDQFTWDLGEAATVPTAGKHYEFYALITDNVDTVLSKAPGEILFTHDPSFQFLLNLGIGAGKGAGAAQAQIVVDQGQVMRVGFNAFDFDNAQQFIRFYTSQLDTVSTDLEDLAAQEGVQAWLMNSTDGTNPNVQNLTTANTSFNWFVENMNGLTSNGDYFIYAFITKDGSNNNWTDANTDKVVARGKVKLSGRERTAIDWDIRIVPNVVPAAGGETITFDVILDTKTEAVDLVSIHLDIDETVIKLTNNDTPFVDQGLFPNIVDNSTNDLGNGTREIDLVLFGNSISGVGVNVIDQTIATFTATVQDNDSSNTVAEDVLFSNAPGRRVIISKDGVDRPVPVPTPAITILHNPLGRIQGRIPLQGRTHNAATITLELREVGSFNPIDHTNIISGTGEIGTENSGIQVATDTDGFFELKKIPTGTYVLVAKTQGYLSSQFPVFDLMSGEILVGSNPTFNNAAIPEDLGELKGGDISSGDEPGVQDNRVDEDDINFIINNFGTLDAPTIVIGDIDGDGVISEIDLFITSSNFLPGSNEGIPPIGNKRSGGNNDGADLELKGIPDNALKDQEFTVSVFAKNVSDLFGYVYTLDYDPAQVELVDNDPILEGDFLRSRQGENRTIFFSVLSNAGRRIINTLLGVNGNFVAGNGIITDITFRALVDGIHPDIRLLNVKLANSEVEISRLGNLIQIPDEFGLAQNYPNPFNPETKIRFELPQTSQVTLKIFNVIGQEVAVLVNTELNAGFHAVKWNGKNRFDRPVASGIYYYRLKTPGFTQTKRMLLIK